MHQSITYVTSSDGTKIAYAVAGDGPPLVKTATYITHLEFDWESPVWRPLLDGLSRYHTLVRYDERGCGLSDWYPNQNTWESWVEDLKAVVDDAGLDQFYLYGQSQGSTVAGAFAARYPERVKKLIIFGGYARGWLHRDLTEEGKREEQMLIDLMKLGWGKDNPAFRHFFTSTLIPNGTREQVEALDTLMRISTEPGIAAQMEREMHLSNIEEIAPDIRCPVLVLHAAGDAAVPYAEGKRLAGLIPGARFVRLNSADHILQEDSSEWTRFWREIYQFLEVQEDFSEVVAARPRQFNRQLRVILFTDIADSTQMALQMGNERWTTLLEQHNSETRQAVSDFRGEVVKATGDGFLILFDSITNAIQCARRLLNTFRDTEIDMRCGVHMGEFERLADDVRGLNVHIASRIVGAAGVNEIWTSAVVRNAMQGADVNFYSQGKHLLKGLPEEQELFVVEA